MGVNNCIYEFFRFNDGFQTKLQCVILIINSNLEGVDILVYNFYM